MPNWEDVSMARLKKESAAGSARKPRVRPDWAVNPFGLILGDSSSIRKVFATKECALEYVRGLPLSKVTKAKLVTVTFLKVETQITEMTEAPAAPPPVLKFRKGKAVQAKEEEEADEEEEDEKPDPEE